MSDDEDKEPIEMTTGTVSQLVFGKTSNGNDKAVIETRGDREFWMFKDDWINELQMRESEYLDTRLEIYYRDVNGDGSFFIAEYVWPADPYQQETWFERYLKARGVLSELKEHKDTQDTEALRQKVSEIYE